MSKTSIPLAVSRPPLLVGREREWAIMEEAWERGQTIYLVGEAGSGKTRLAQDFVASKGPGLYLPARPGSQEIPFGVAASLLRVRLAAAPQVSLPEWVRRELSRILPELHPQGPLPLGEEDRLRLYQAYFEAVRLSGAGFVASISDDAHYYDQATVDLGAFMMSQPVPPNTKAIPRYLVIYRKEEMAPSSQAVIDGLVRSGMAVRIDLGPLPLEQVQELLEEFEIPGIAELALPIQRFTGGNPQFVLETLRHLIETGQLERGWPGRLPPPGKIKQVITGRLEKLSPLALNLARAAAVLGSDLSVERAAQVMEASPLSLAPAWEELEAAQVLQGMAFSHDSLYETTLSTMPQPIKGYLHRQSAAVLEQAQAHPAKIASHWLEGGEALRAAPHLLRAAQEADFASRVSEAVDFAERAMTIYQQQGLQDREFEALWWLGRMLQAHGDNPRLDQVSQHLLALARTPQQRARALDHRAFLLYRVGRLEESLELAQQAYPLAVEAEDLYCQTELKQIQAQVYTRLGRVDEAEAALGAFKELAQRLGDPEAVIAAVVDQGQLAASQDHHCEAIKLYREGLQAIEQWGRMLYAQVGFLRLTANSQLALGQTLQAQETLQEAKTLADTHEIGAHVRTRLLLTESNIQLNLGNLGQALELVEAARALDSGEDWAGRTGLVKAMILRQLGQNALSQSELQQALQSRFDPTVRGAMLTLLGRITGSAEPLEEAQALLQQSAGQLFKAELWLAQAEQTPPQEALKLAGQALSVAETLGLGLLEADACIHQARAWLALGRPQEASRYGARAVQAAEGCVLTHLQALLLQYQGLQALADPEAALALAKAHGLLMEVAERVPLEYRQGFLSTPLSQAVVQAAQAAPSRFS